MKYSLRDRIVLLLIISNEFCERYTFYSIKSILFAFILEYYFLTSVQATWVVHSFIFLCYFFSVVGGILADNFLGRYSTILYFNLIYAAGNFLLCLSSMNRSLAFLFSGLLLVAVGTGGIKPCISAFGGDQAKNISCIGVESFFNLFYLFINTGSLIGVLVSPVLASKACVYGLNCYLRAFQVATVLHLISLLLFLVGSKFYYKNIPSNVTFQAIYNLAISALQSNLGPKLKIFGRGKKIKKDNVNAFMKNLYRADNVKYTGIKEDMLRVFGIMKVFAFVPFFWMLFDQQSSSWIEQGMKMNPEIVFLSWKFEILPSQMQALNSIAVIFMIPIFSRAVYPTLDRIGLNFHSLKRMYSGLFLASFSFLVSTVLEGLLLQNTKLSILWQMPQYVIITMAEILMSITGLEFAYSQSPDTMRSFVFSIWLMSSAVGNFFILLFSTLNPLKQLGGLSLGFYNQLFFGIIGLLASTFFVLLSKSFKYNR